MCISDKTSMPCLSSWLNTGAIRSMKVTGKAIMLCSYGIHINVMCSITLSVLVEILSRVDSDHGTGPRRNGRVNSRSTLCPIERRSCLPKTLLLALIWLFTFCKLGNFFLLDLASIKTLLACGILWGM